MYADVCVCSSYHKKFQNSMMRLLWGKGYGEVIQNSQNYGLKYPAYLCLYDDVKVS